MTRGSAAGSRADSRLLAIVGPTATGKTPLSVAVAERLAPAELLNADSRQVIRGLHVATCTATPAELRGIPAHLFGMHDPGASFSVAEWLAAARDTLAHLHAQPVLVGGTGLYVTALIDGLDLARVPPDPERRAERAAIAATPDGLQSLATELVARDPGAADAVDLENPRRVIRALEILDATGAPLRHARGRSEPSIPTTLIGLDAPRPLHEALIAQRARAMLETGALLDEVHSALGRGVTRGALESAGIGYREALAVIDGQVTPEQAAEQIAQRTRRYAKAQRTWFRKDGRIRWLQRDEGPLEPLVDEVLDAFREDARAGQ